MITGRMREDIEARNRLYMLIADYVDSTPYSAEAVQTVAAIERRVGDDLAFEHRLYARRSAA
jgi:hypothetical protein